MQFRWNSQYCDQHVIPDIQQSVCLSNRRKTLKGILLHPGNASVHNSRPSSEKIESAKLPIVPHPPDGPDQAPSDFFHFGYLKEKLGATSFTTSDDLIFAVRQIFSDIPQMLLNIVFANRITREASVLKKGGEY
jgi:hypothetical protein